MLKRCARVVLSAIAWVTVVGTITGCNTIRGAGQDIEKAGQVIKEEATAVKQKL